MSELTPPVDPQRDHVSGPEGVPTIVEYGDFECPYCVDAYAAMKRLKRDFGDSVRFVFREFPLDKHPHAREAALAAEAAGAQGKFWEMHDKLFQARLRLDSQHLRKYAEEIGLDVERFERDIASEETAKRVEDDIESGYGSEIQGTPSFFLDGQPYERSYDAATLAQAIEQAGQRPRPPV